MPAETLDPNFYHKSQTFGGFEWPPRPLSVTGFIFDRATGVFDFSGVPGFDLGRVREIQATFKTPGPGFYPTVHSRSLYGRPVPPPLGFAAVDGVPVPPPPRSGKVVKVKPDTTDLPADAEILVFYDP